MNCNQYKLIFQKLIIINIFIENNKFEKYYFTPKSYEELKTAVDEWCDNKKEALIKYGNINSWNTTYITNMKVLFNDKQNFNDNISDWNVSNVTNMNCMFYNAESFNQPLNNWNVSNVENMEDMFCCATSFNQPLNNWDVSNVEDMNGMFYNTPLTEYPEWYKNTFQKKVYQKKYFLEKSISKKYFLEKSISKNKK